MSERGPQAKCAIGGGRAVVREAGSWQTCQSREGGHTAAGVPRRSRVGRTGFLLVLRSPCSGAELPSVACMQRSRGPGDVAMRCTLISHMRSRDEMDARSGRADR
jgi:hypothetical protein